MEEIGGGGKLMDIYLSVGLPTSVSPPAQGRRFSLTAFSWPVFLACFFFFLLNLSLYPKYRLMHILNVNVVIKLNSETIFVKIQTFLRLDFQ